MCGGELGLVDAKTQFFIDNAVDYVADGLVGRRHFGIESVRKGCAAKILLHGETCAETGNSMHSGFVKRIACRVADVQNFMTAGGFNFDGNIAHWCFADDEKISAASLQSYFCIGQYSGCARPVAIVPALLYVV